MTDVPIQEWEVSFLRHGQPCPEGYSPSTEISKSHHGAHVWAIAVREVKHIDILLSLKGEGS